MEGLSDLMGSVGQILGATGWLGNLSVAIVAGFVLLMRMRGIGRDDQTGVQQGAFQERLLKALEGSHAREDAMLTRIDNLSRDNDQLRAEVREGRYEIELVRNQLRTLAALLRQVRDGVLPPSAIPIPDFPPEGST